jgi:hypothetical protein
MNVEIDARRKVISAALIQEAKIEDKIDLCSLQSSQKFRHKMLYDKENW